MNLFLDKLAILILYCALKTPVSVNTHQLLREDLSYDKNKLPLKVKQTLQRTKSLN